MKRVADAWLSAFAAGGSYEIDVGLLWVIVVLVVGLFAVAAYGYFKMQRVASRMRQAEQHYRSLFEHAPIMYVAIRVENNLSIIADCNQCFLETLGYRRDQVIGRALHDFYSAGARQKSLVESGIFASPAVSNIERELQPSQGPPIPTLMRVDPQIGPDGRLAGRFITYIDIRERKKMEAALGYERDSLARRVEERTADLSRVNAELQRANRLKDEFLANMSHELRTPLNAILGLSDALVEQAFGPLESSQVAALRTISDNGRHLLRMINDVLDITKIEAGKLDLLLADVNVPGLCQAVLRAVQEPAARKNLQVACALDPQALTVQADVRRLKQVLLNLLDNAIKFTDPGGKIGLEVACLPESQALQFTVWDTGIGIEPEKLDQLFQPFTQLDGSLARRYSGIGLGLVLVKRLVELHGGAIGVESSPNSGSRFYFCLEQGRLDESQACGNL